MSMLFPPPLEKSYIWVSNVSPWIPVFSSKSEKRIICHLHEEKENQTKIHKQKKKSIFSRSLTYIGPSEKKQSKKIFALFFQAIWP